MDQINKLRQEYESWKKDNPGLQNEGLINRFIILRNQVGTRFKPADSLLDIDAASFLKMAEPAGYAPVRHSGQVQGDPVRLDEILPYFKDFVIAHPVTWVVGGIVTHPEEGSENDVDLLQMFPDLDEIQRVVNFRIYRMLPPNLADRVHGLWENRGARSPFTDFLPLYRLKMERIPEAEIVHMAEGKFTGKVRAKSSDLIRQQAAKAWQEDKITPGEFYLSTKPVRGYYPGKPQTMDLFLNIWDEFYKYPGLSSKKMDGEHLIIHKIKDKVVIYSEDGTELPKLPNLKKAVASLPPEVLVFECETEHWDYEKGQHLPRESVDTGVDFDLFTSSVFDCLYFKGLVPTSLIKEVELFQRDPEAWKKQALADESHFSTEFWKGWKYESSPDSMMFDDDIHKLPCALRFKFMEVAGIQQCTNLPPKAEFRLNLIAHFRDDDRKALRKRTEFLRALPGSEGNVVSRWDSPYILASDRRPYQMLKFHNSTQFHAIVIGSKETKTKGVFNLLYGLLAGGRPIQEQDIRIIAGQKVCYVGKSFATTLHPARGSCIIVECETLNVTFDLRSASFNCTAWAPRVMGLWDRDPDTIQSAEDRALKDHCFQGKVIDVEGNTFYLEGHSGEELPSKNKGG